MKYLFWNVHRNEDINAIIHELVIENDISVIVLAEYTANSSDLINLLSSSGINMQTYTGCSKRISLFSSVSNIDYRTDTDHAIIRIINNRDILCCVHLNSQIYAGNNEIREIMIEQILGDIRKVEQELSTQNTIVVGDFNINPYDPSIVNAKYFHGIPVFEEAKRGSRIVAGKQFSMFYNPMWNLFGDATPPYGTYYYNGNDAINTYWNIYDQVIIRPALKPRFDVNNLKILTETKQRYLLDKNGHPDKCISDHLPIIFEIKEDLYEI